MSFFNFFIKISESCFIILFNMFKYISIIKFLLTHDLTNLKNYWVVEYIHKDFTWIRLFRKLLRKNSFLAWYRLAYFMYRLGDESERTCAKKIINKLNQKHCLDISIKADIDIGLHIWHLVGIVITPRVKIGKNCNISSNVTIGFKSYYHDGYLQVGDNVTFGTNSMMFGQNTKIGNNVVIGAMTFVNKDIPDNCTVYTQKTNIVIQS